MVRVFIHPLNLYLFNKLFPKISKEVPYAYFELEIIVNAQVLAAQLPFRLQKYESFLKYQDYQKQNIKQKGTKGKQKTIKKQTKKTSKIILRSPFLSIVIKNFLPLGLCGR